MGSASVRPDAGESDLTASVWCLGTSDELQWWIEQDDVPGGDMLLFNPSRTQLLVGSPDEFIRVEAATGSVRDRQLKTELRDFGLAADDTLVGMEGGRLVRRALDGQQRPTWAERGGIPGLVDGLVEPWLSRSDSVPAMMLDGRSPNLVSASDRAIRLGNSARTIAGPNGELHLVQATTLSFGKGDDRWAVTWLRFDVQGMVLHRIVVPLETASDDAHLDVMGRLWVRASPEKASVIVRIDPKSDTAQVVASSRRSDRIVGFAVDPQGELRLPTKKKVDTPQGDAARLPITRRRSGLRPLAIGSLLALAVINAAMVPLVLASRSTLLTKAAAGASMRVTAGKSGHKTLQPEELAALAPGQLAYAVELVVLAVGLLLLTAVARKTPERSVNLAGAWVTIIAVVAVVLNAAVTLRPMGGFDTFTIAGIPALVHLATWMGLLVLGAFGSKLVK